MKPDAGASGGQAPSTDMRTVVLASSAGTAFEWYDFFVYGSLNAVMSPLFLAKLDPVSAQFVGLAIFGVGFLFRPVGALVFGRIGDRFGRKGSFLFTVIIMGAATFAIGLLPTYSDIGPAAAFLLVALRVLQGLAVGGEYGGAAIYVAEHADSRNRGRATAWIQSSASLGLVGALVVILVTRKVIGEEAFAQWGWRIPFLLSAGLLAVSIWMRLSLEESPAFRQMQAEGRQSRAPFAEVFFKWRNLKIALIALVSLMFAQGALWYCLFFYTQTFLGSFLKVDGDIVNWIMIFTAVLSIPLYVIFGQVSDWIGRKPVMLFGMGLALLTIFPSYQALANGTNPALHAAQKNVPVVVHADTATCTFRVDIFGDLRYETACDIARRSLTDAGVAFTQVQAPSNSDATVAIGDQTVKIAAGVGLEKDALATLTAASDKALKDALRTAGYPISADTAAIRWLFVISGLLTLTIAATALYGPLAAALVELFPTNVRYTALSTPYHIGVGWVGGLMPMSAYAMAAATGNLFAGLWYSVAFVGISFVCCIFLFPETRGKPLRHEA